ncbi:MAG: hypothetical protein KDK91_17840 [Gammaproteobacteria bacterium]|nr:hypothetical protein [Gammaproteobacteria bacterium]
MKLGFLVLTQLTIALGSTAWAQGDAYDFAVVGDLPYNVFEREHLPALLDQIGAAGNRFVVHVGDIKHGSAPCDDESLTTAFRMLDASPLPLIYTPGDNDWADCRREAAGGFKPLERLAHLREQFFASSRSLGAVPLDLERQNKQAVFGNFPENQRWQRGPVLFATLHVVGGNNEMRRKASQTEVASYRAREQANTAWLAQAFALARSEDLGAIVIFIHGNPRLEAYRKNTDDNGYSVFLHQLDEESSRFTGQVILIHGDTHHQRIELPETNPRQSRRLARLTRIETYGHPFMGWIQISVRPGENPLLRFEAHAYSTNSDRSAFP